MTNTRALSDGLEKLQGPDMAPRKARCKASNGAAIRGPGSLFGLIISS